MSKKNRKATRLRTRGPGRPLKKTHPRIKFAAKMVGIAFGAAVTVLATAILGELAMLLMSVFATSAQVVSFWNALKAGKDAVDLVVYAVAGAALFRAIFKVRRKR